jgi:hypothetical protein
MNTRSRGVSEKGSEVGVRWGGSELKFVSYLIFNGGLLVVGDAEAKLIGGSA